MQNEQTLAPHASAGVTNGKWKSDAIDFCIERTRANLGIVTSFPELAKDGKWEYTRADGGWVGGFWTGLLWLAFAHTHDEMFERAAR